MPAKADNVVDVVNPKTAAPATQAKPAAASTAKTPRPTTARGAPTANTTAKPVATNEKKGGAEPAYLSKPKANFKNEVGQSGDISDCKIAMATRDRLAIAGNKQDAIKEADAKKVGFTLPKATPTPKLIAKKDADIVNLGEKEKPKTDTAPKAGATTGARPQSTRP